MLAGARPHPDERAASQSTALWLAVATGGVALGACVASLRGLRHGRAFPRFVAAALGTTMALTTIAIVIAALQNKRGHEHTSGDDRRRTRTVLVVTLLTEMSLAAIRAAAADVVRKIVGDQFRQRGDAFDEVTGFETSRVRPVAERRRTPASSRARAEAPPQKPSRRERRVICQETIGSGGERLPCACRARASSHRGEEVVPRLSNARVSCGKIAAARAPRPVFPERPCCCSRVLPLEELFEQK